MGSQMGQKIECADCGEVLPTEWISLQHRDNCPRCNSPSKLISIDVIDKLEMPIRDTNYNSKKNPRHEFFEGDDLRKSDGKWMKKRRVIDKNNDSYFEEVIDPETGEVIHKCEEALSEHFGHGSARLPKA